MLGKDSLRCRAYLRKGPLRAGNRSFIIYILKDAKDSSFRKHM